MAGKRRRDDDLRSLEEKRDDAIAATVLYGDQVRHGKLTWLDDRLIDNGWLMIGVGGCAVLALLSVAVCAGGLFLLSRV